MACLILAGGDASRLGSTDPKGMFNPGIPGVSSIFELIVEKLKRLSYYAQLRFPNSKPARARDNVILVVMTNPENYEAITGFFAQNNNFGYSSLIFFSQPHLPLALPESQNPSNPNTTHFKVLLKSQGKILFAPNGNGGIFQ